MKIKYILMLISFLIYSEFLYSQENDQGIFQHIPIDFTEISLKPPFVTHEDVQQGWKELVMDFGKTLGLPGRFYDRTLIEKLSTFITNHPSDTAALSAKLYLAEYLQRAGSCLAATFSDYLLESEAYEQDLQVTTELVNLVTEDMLRIYQELTIEAPEMWQGKLASHYTREYFVAEEERGADYRTRRRELWPLLLDIQHEKDFSILWAFEGMETPIEASISAERVWFALEENNFTEAETELTRMKAKYPNSLMTKGAEREIEEAYVNEFEGGLHSAPIGKLLAYLTNAPDSLEGRQAAAALGNLAIWKSLREQEREEIVKILKPLVLDYIDRAMADNAVERDAMIDLIYRLWHLAVPALLETLDADDADRVAFAGDRLLYMRNEEIITAIIEKARAATDETKKAQLVGLLTRMNEPCVPVMRFRECLPDAQLQELYQRLVVPVLEEFQAAQPTPTP